MFYIFDRFGHRLRWHTAASRRRSRPYVKFASLPPTSGLRRRESAGGRVALAYANAPKLRNRPWV